MLLTFVFKIVTDPPEVTLSVLYVQLILWFPFQFYWTYYHSADTKWTSLLYN